ncbi:MAG: type II toxin-antitoxin system HipA family toxin [Rhizomicrobium sp.]
MISKPAPSECFVYITLPGTTQPVTAARFELMQDRGGNPLGRLVYGKSYLERTDAVELDPVELKLASREYETTALKGIFGALRDAGPDYWGRRVIERNVGKSALGELDYLLNAPDDRAGALGFGFGVKPPAPLRKFNQTVGLEQLQATADAIVNDEELPLDANRAQAEELLLIGTAMGGARPKVVVEDNDGLWIAKFNRANDKWNNARVEHAMLQLGRTCGLVTAESRVTTIGNRDVLLVKRFDREKTKGGYLRARMISGLTLLQTEDTFQSRDKWSYIFLAEELRRVSAEPKRDAAELFKRMCFNALISNTDDHPRNHAAIAKERTWKLSPAYDLNPAPYVSLDRRDLALICGEQGRLASAKNLLSQSPRFLLEADSASALVRDMKEQVRTTWYDVARRSGVSEKDSEAISGAFAYPGFDLDHIDSA